MPVFKSFCAASDYIRREDVRKASELRKSIPQPRMPGTGPRIAR